MVDVESMARCVTIAGWFLFYLPLLIVPLTALAQPASSQTPSEPLPPTPTQTLIIGTKDAPPFAMKAPDGSWRGLSIELWRQMAARLSLSYKFKEESLEELLADTSAGKLDASIAAITVTASREQKLDFTQPYFMTGLGIAVPNHPAGGIGPLLRGMFSTAFVQAILGLAGLLLFVGFALWLAERKQNPQFSGKFLHGLGSGFWWSAVTMTTVGYGDKAPMTAAGRAIAICWMFASVITISGITAGIATSLTAAQIKGSVTGPRDLASVRVGSVPGSSSAGYLDGAQVVFKDYASPDAGLAALDAGKIDAFVYDKPLLQYLVRHDYAASLRVLPAVFDKQGYAIALPNGSALREPLDRVLLAEIQTNWWQTLTFHYLGGD